LLVADLTLPDLPGQDMALRMLEENPELRILLCSGYPFAVDSLPAPVQKRFASLQKPFLPNMLAKAIEDLLQRKIE
jgi:DNA-binding NtrC family response regulator